MLSMQMLNGVFLFMCDFEIATLQQIVIDIINNMCINQFSLGGLSIASNRKWKITHIAITCCTFVASFFSGIALLAVVIVERYSWEAGIDR